MFTAHRSLQQPNQIVDVRDWEPDDEFPIGPQGRKPKSILICPTPAPWPFLYAGHRYLFKQPAGSKVQQIWAEIIAYELARDRNVVVPPAFAAINSRDASPGVLIEFFYGYQAELAPARFVHAIEMFQGQGLPLNEKIGSLKDNIALTRKFKATNWLEWWARTIAFDALIANTDRHSENWGFLVQQSEGFDPAYILAPVFDNGTSLGNMVRDDDLPKFSTLSGIDKFIAHGHHHFGWTSTDGARQHVDLCSLFVSVRTGARTFMQDVIDLSDARIVEVANWCTQFGFPVPFVEARASFVKAQIVARRDAIARAIGE